MEPSSRGVQLLLAGACVHALGCVLICSGQLCAGESRVPPSEVQGTRIPKFTACNCIREGIWGPSKQ